MKKTDIALLILIVAASAGLAYWLASVTIGESNDKPISVRIVESINVDEVDVDKDVFSKQAINPTVETTISGTDLTSFINDSDDANEAAGSRQEGEISPAEED